MYLSLSLSLYIYICVYIYIYIYIYIPSTLGLGGRRRAGSTLGAAPLVELSLLEAELGLRVLGFRV